MRKTNCPRLKILLLNQLMNLIYILYRNDAALHIDTVPNYVTLWLGYQRVPVGGKVNTNTGDRLR